MSLINPIISTQNSRNILEIFSGDVDYGPFHYITFNPYGTCLFQVMIPLISAPCR